jgi:prepilin-type N-terminal cleavage/methylation domain-containing protein
MKHTKKQFGRWPARTQAGMTLVEVMISVAVLALFMWACFACIVFSRLTSMKSKEEGIAMDFLIHYVETVKALPFSEVASGRPINPLLDGTAGAPDIRIPADASWVALNTADFENFHPDLLWVHNRNPLMRVALNPRKTNGAPHDIHLNVTMAWDAPLKRAGPLQVQLDLVRIKDL